MILIKSGDNQWIAISGVLCVKSHWRWNQTSCITCAIMSMNYWIVVILIPFLCHQPIFFINILITNQIELQRPNVFAKIAVNCANRMYPDEFIRWGMLKKGKSPNFNAPYAAFGWAAFILLIGTPRRTYPNRPSVRFVEEVSVHRMRTRFVCDFNRNSDCHFKRSAITLIVKNSLFRSTWNECTANVQSAIFVKKHSAVSQF